MKSPVVLFVGLLVLVSASGQGPAARPQGPGNYSIEQAKPIAAVAR